MKLQSAAELKAELESVALANFTASPRFGLSSPEKRLAFAGRSGLLPSLLVSFLDFQQKWETATQVPLSLVFPFRVEIGYISTFFNFNKEQSGQWLFPFARTDTGFVLAFWTWGLSWCMAPIVLLDEDWHEEPRVLNHDFTGFLLQTAQNFEESTEKVAGEVQRDFVSWTQEHIRVLAVEDLGPSAQITEWDWPEFPNFAQWCKQMMR